jgi:hypothetical protein
MALRRLSSFVCNDVASYILGVCLRRQRRCVGGACHGARADSAARVIVAHGYCSTAAQLPRLKTEKELNQLK